jgi:hypothetical protein
VGSKVYWFAPTAPFRLRSCFWQTEQTLNRFTPQSFWYLTVPSHIARVNSIKLLMKLMEKSELQVAKHILCIQCFPICRNVNPVCCAVNF